MTVTLRDPALRRLLQTARADGVVDLKEVESLLESAQDGRGLSQTERGDLRNVLSTFEAALTPEAAAALGRALEMASGAVRGPEEAAEVGSVVQAPPIRFTPTQVLEAYERLEARAAQEPGLKAKLANGPFPRSALDQLDWALAREAGGDPLTDSVWNTATNDGRASLVAYTRGLVAGRQAGLPITDTLEEEVAFAEQQFHLAGATDPSLYERASQLPFPTTRAEQLSWAAGLASGWDSTLPEQTRRNPKAMATLELVRGVLAKRTSGEATPVLSERRTLKVDGDTRVYAVHTPPGKRPAGGWPTVLMFHGSYGGHAPEQSKEYQQMKSLADAAGVQVIFPVGLPQDRSDAGRTGRGMLNWDPVGAGPSGANDRFVHTLLKKLISSGDVDRSRVFAAGHSQGGYYVSNLVAAYPEVFAGAAILGAGEGSVSQRIDLGKLPRQTPLLLQVNQDDIHLQSGQALRERLSSQPGAALEFVSLPGRGHEVLPEDYQRMLAGFAKLGRYQESNAGALDGRTGSPLVEQRPPTEVFLPFIDLQRPPAHVAQDRTALAALRAIASFQGANLDGRPEQVTVAEWQQAMVQAHLFPASMRMPLFQLRQHFVIAPPPQGPQLDLARLSPALRLDPDVQQALTVLQLEPYFDVDGYPGIVTQEELQRAEQFSAQLGPQVARGLQLLRAAFDGGGATPPPGRRETTQHSVGTVIEAYPGSDRAVAQMNGIIDDLSASPTFREVMARTRVLITPPGKGMDALPEAGGMYSTAEGVAMTMGPDGVSGPPTLCITHGSLEQWSLGAAHELIHLLQSHVGAEADALVEKTWKQLGGKVGTSGYPNPAEMFAYLGQWYLAGFGKELAQVSPEGFALCEKLLGDARVDPGALRSQDAKAALSGLVSWMRSGA